MKMKKKFQKKSIILNRNIHIKNYNNYLIYSYLNNYNLKLFFFFLQKKKNYIKNLNFWKSLLLKSNYTNFSKITNHKLNKNLISTFKNKFFDNLYYLENKNKQVNENSNLINYNNYLCNNVELNNFLNNDFLKDIILLNFIQNLLKTYEIYKVITLLLYIKK